MVRGEKKNWKMPVIEYMMPLKKWESIDVTDESICLDGNVYQDKSLRVHDKVIVVEYEEILTVFDEKGRFIVELMKESPGLCGSTPKGIKDASGALEKHRIKEMFELVDKTLTECFRDPHVKEAYKERIRYRMVKIIDDAYKQSLR